MRASSRKALRDYSLAIGIAVTVALSIRFFVIEAYRIPTVTMRPTLEPGDTIFVSKSPIGYRGDLARGDVVVFSTPAEPGRDYIKRLVGMPGDSIEIRKGDLFINGKSLLLPLAAKAPKSNCAEEKIEERVYGICRELPLLEDYGPEKVPPTSVFVIGDGRTLGEVRSGTDAKAQRGWGMIPRSTIKGKALWVWLSIEPNSTVRGATTRSALPHIRTDRMFKRVQ